MLFCGLIAVTQLIAQTPVVVVPQQDLTGTSNISFPGRDGVKILPGTRFAPDATHKFKAWIDQSTLVPLQNGWTNEQSIASRTLDPTLAVGTTVGSINVSPTGAASYSIPFILPPATAGFAPSVGIAYNSSAGNGVMGLGWDIAGLSSISLSSKNVYNDGVIRGVTFDNADPFSLDGNRLILQSDGTYRTEIESFSKITITGTAMDEKGAPLSFKVYTKDGLIMEYGTTVDSRLKHSDPSISNKTISWYLSKVTDQFGNYYTYTYKNNPLIGEFRISRIDFTSNDEAGLIGNNSVVFIYETKPTNQISNAYMYGSLVADNVVLKEVRIYSDETRSHTYKFNYSNAQTFQQLVEVQEYGSDNSRYNSTIINWLNTKTTYPLPVINNIFTDEDDYINDHNYQLATIIGDFDGDGKDNGVALTYTFNPEISSDCKVYIHSQQICQYQLSCRYDIVHSPFEKFNYRSASICDFNADGKEDILVKENQTGTYLNTFKTLTSNGTYFTIHPDFSYNNSVIKEVLGDFNRDGLTDLLIVDYSTNKFKLYKSTPSVPLSDYVELNSFYYSRRFSSSNPEYNEAFPLDYNGDGLLDLIIQNKLYVNNGNGFNDYITINTPDLRDSIGFREKIEILDVNGDGLSDFHAVSQYGSRLFYTSTGNNNSNGGPFVMSDASFLPNLEYDENHNPYFHVFADFNKDGKTDYFYTTNERTHIETSGNAQFVFNKNFEKGEYILSNNIYNYSSESAMKKVSFFFLADNNGNGVPEVYFNYIKYENASPLVEIEDRCIETEPAMLINGISNGLGANINIAYSSGGGIEQTCTYPITTRKVLNMVVSSVSTSNGLAQGTNLVRYSYGSPMFHIQGKGFLGYMYFRKDNYINHENGSEIMIRESNSYDYLVTDPNTNNTFYYNHPTGSSVLYKIGTSAEKMMNSTSYTTLCHDFGNKLFFPYVSEVVTDKYQWDSPLDGTPDIINTTTEYTYSETDIIYGNISDITTTNNNNVSVINFRNYLAKGSWCPNKYSSKKTGMIDGTNPNQSMTETYGYNSKGFLYTSSAPPGMGDPTVAGDNQTVTTNYYPNPVGIPNRVEVYGPNGWITTISEFDSRYRFAVKTTNPLGHVAEATYESLYGNMISSKDPNGLITTYKYDGFGRNTETTLPDGNTVKKELFFGKPADCLALRDLLYHVKNTVPGSQPTYECFDKLGRSIRTMARPSDDVKVYTTTFYNSFGKVAQTRQNTPNGTRLVTNYTYDEFLRDYKIELFTENSQYDPNRQENNYLIPLNNVVTTTYNGLSIIINDNGKTTTKTMTSNGLLSSVEDNDGNLITYKYSNSANKLTKTIAVGVTTTITYDKYGRQKTIEEPNRGITSFNYNLLNQVTFQQDNKGNKYNMTYDLLGRLLTKEEIPAGSTTGTTTTYTYDTEPNGKGAIASVTFGSTGQTTTYKYDALSRNYKVIEIIDGKTFTTTNRFDNFGRINLIKYPSNGNTEGDFYVNYIYDAYNKLVKITTPSSATIWELQSINGVGATKHVKMGSIGAIEKKYSYTNYNTLSESTIKYTGSSPWENKWSYSIDPTNRNLDSRTNVLTVNGSIQRNITERFEYDNLDRLLNIYKDAGQGEELTQALSYNDNGNIMSKSDVGTYSYDSPPHPHSASSIENSPKPLTIQGLTYTPFNKMKTIDVFGVVAGSKYQQTLSYGFDNERRKTVDQYSTDGGANYSNVRTKYYAKNYELIIQGATTKEIHYINAPDGLAAIYELKNGNGSLYYTQTDYQGSLMMVVYINGTRKNDLSYDAWGNRRDPNTWEQKNATDFVNELNTPTLITDRGYTLHEHLDVYGLINMNGRAYDQRMAQFLSPDPFVQAPENTQSYNRNAYCFNNPMKYTDPTGYFTGWYVDQYMNVVGWDQNYMTNDLHLVYGNDLERARSAGMIIGVPLSKMKFAKLVPTYEERLLLKSLYLEGQKQTDFEIGQSISKTPDGIYYSDFFKGDENKEKSGRTPIGPYRYNKEMEEKGFTGNLYPTFNAEPYIFGHIHNMKDKSNWHTPSTLDDITRPEFVNKIQGNPKIGVIFDYCDKGERTYLFSSFSGEKLFSMDAYIVSYKFFRPVYVTNPDGTVVGPF